MHKRNKITRSIVILLAVLISLISCVSSAYAGTLKGDANDDVQLIVTRNENTFLVDFQALHDLDVGGGLGFYYYYNEELVQADEENCAFINYDHTAFGLAQNNTVTNKVGIPASALKFIGSGDAVVELVYTAIGEFKPDTEYEFILQMDALRNADGVRYSWYKNKFSVTYIEHTVSFDLNGGESEAIPNQYVVDGETASEPEDPIREGYTFKGWKKGDESFSFDTAITGKTELIAEWESNKHTVKYEVTGDMPEGYTSPADSQEEFGSTVKVESAPEAAQYTEKNGIPGVWTFTGWTTPEGLTVEGGAFTMPDGDVTITGFWTFEADKYDVFYKVSGDKPSDYGEPYGPKNIAVGTSLDMPTDLTTTDTSRNEVPGTWTFSGWTITSPEDLTASEGKYTMPASDVTISGSWSFTPASYTVTWKNGDETLETDETAYGETPSYDGAAPTKEATAEYTYTFDGWSPDISPVTGDVTYTAQFTATPIPTYTITFVDEDGTTVLDTVTVKEGETPSYNGPAPTKASDVNNTYTFNGWTPAIVPATEDAAYTASYQANAKDKYNLTDPVLPQPTEPAAPATVTITWLNYDGTLIEKTTANYNTVPSHAEPTLTPSAEGKTYTFKGWNPEVAAATADTAYTAQFTEKDDDTGDEQDTTVPNPVTPENTDTDPTNHEDLPSITTKDHTYEIYQIFTGDYAVLDGEDVLSNIVWGVNGSDPNNSEASTGDSVDQAILTALSAVVDKELDREKLDEIEKYLTIDGNPYRTITLGPDDTENSIQLPPGYYLIRDVENSQTDKHDAYTTYITVVIKNYTIQPKSVIPTVDKQVYDNNDGSNSAGWAETADHAINEAFQFALIATIPQNEHLKDYTSGYTVKFTDTMSSGMTYDGIDKVTVNGTQTTAYTVSGVNAGEAGKTWTIEMNVRSIIGEETFGTGTGDITVIVTYNAHLNENAITHKESDAGSANNTNKNSVCLEYSNNPNTVGSGDMGKTTEDSVWVFTYEVDNKKVDQAGNELAGAGFKLYDSTGNVEIPLAYDSGRNAYYPAASGGVEMMTTDSSSQFNIIGLDVGTYVLKETTVPAGYNALGDTTVTISASHEENEAGTGAKLNLTGSNMSNVIVNQSGSELPSTGGIGTTIFYILGSILALGAGIILVSRRRMGTM